MTIRAEAQADDAQCAVCNTPREWVSYWECPNGHDARDAQVEALMEILDAIYEAATGNVSEAMKFASLNGIKFEGFNSAKRTREQTVLNLIRELAGRTLQDEGSNAD